MVIRKCRFSTNRHPIAHWALSASLLYCLCLSLRLFTSTAFAQSYEGSREVIQYTYDDVGNIVGVTKDILQAPPTITAIVPGTLRIGSTIQFTLTGTNLANAKITTDDRWLVVDATRSTNDQVVIDLTAREGTVEGNHTLIASPSLGSATVELTVKPQLPQLLIAPVPVVVSQGESMPLYIDLKIADVKPHTFTVSIADSVMATLSRSSLTIAAGEKTASSPIILSGIAFGITTVTASAPDYGTFSLTVFVVPNARLPVGVNRFYSPPLGMLLQTPPEPPAIVTRGPFRDELRLRKGKGDFTEINQLSPIVSPHIRVVKGSGILRVSPLSLLADSSPTELVVHGIALSTVDSLSIVPSDDLIIGDIRVDADGSAVRVPVTVGPDVVLGQRQLVLSAAGRLIAPVSVGANRLSVGGQPPTIDSIDPITIHRGVTTTLTVRGTHLQQAQAIAIAPAEGIILASQPSVNDTGTEVTLDITIAASASPGTRVVTVTTPTGTSSAVASSSNTLTITRRAGTVITPIRAAAVGIRKPVSVSTEQRRTYYALPIGLSKGLVLRDLQPTTRAIGSNFTLMANGVGLQDVDDIAFIPETGITLGTLTTSPTGDNIMVNVTIAVDAPTTLRRVQLSRSGILIPVAIGGNDRFQVTAPQPVVESVTPNFILTNDIPQLLTVRGQLLNDVQQLRIEPADGISIDTPQINAQGDTITVEVTASQSAATGTRVLVVDTLGGSSDATPSPANTLVLAGGIDRVVKMIVSPSLGLTKIVTSPPVLLERTVRSALLGVKKAIVIEPTITHVDLYARSIGITLGPVVSRALPAAASVDTSLILVIQGAELDAVTNVQLQPSTGLTLGSIAISARQISVPLTIAADAPQTKRRIVLTTASGTLAFSNPAQGRLKIAGPPATIDSIEPIQQTLGANFTLLIRGAQLHSAQSVSMIPTDSRISIGRPVANGEGTELAVQVNLSETVTPGPRVVVVTTLAGPTSSIPEPANTFTVVNE